MKLLKEEVSLDLLESNILESEGQKKYTIKGPFLESQKQNKNKRIYPKPVIEQRVSEFQEEIRNNRAVGELNHPDGRLEIDPAEIALKITSLKMDGNLALGEAEILTTPKGMILRSLMDSGIKSGVSSRGYGTLKESVVQNDYKLIAIDSVWNPSAHAAWVENILESKTEWIIENGILVEREIEILNKKLENFNGKSLEDTLREVFEMTLNFAGKKR